MRSQLVQDLASLAIDTSTIRQDVLGSDATMGADLSVGDLVIVEQLHKVRAGDVQQIGGLLRGHFRVYRKKGDGITTGHLLENIQEQPNDRRGELQSLDRTLRLIKQSDPDLLVNAKMGRELAARLFGHDSLALRWQLKTVILVNFSQAH